MKIKLDLPEIEGFEYTGEYRAPNSDDWFLDGTGKPYQCQTSNYEGRPSFPILKKKAPKYKTVTNGDFLDLSGHIDLSAKFVEIKALKDAIHIVYLMNVNSKLKAEECAGFDDLLELIK